MGISFTSTTIATAPPSQLFRMLRWLGWSKVKHSHQHDVRMAATVEIHHEVMESFPGGWSLCFQQVTYHYDDDTPEEGFRFIWRRPNGHLQAARGQARLPDIAIINRLMERAREDGWA